MSDATSELSDDDVLAEIEAAIEDGERDLCAGGVAVPVLADRLDRDLSTIRRRCKRLEQAGRLQTVQGVAQDSLQPRTGYLPTPDE